MHVNKQGILKAFKHLITFWNIAADRLAAEMGPKSSRLKQSTIVYRPDLSERYDVNLKSPKNFVAIFTMFTR